MPTRDISLTDHFDDFIAAGIQDGRFRDASEAVGAGLLLLEKQEKDDEAKLEALRAIAKEAFDALDRGEGIAFSSEDFDDFVNEAVAEARTARTATHA